MKSLQYSNDSQQSVKIGDTDTTIKLLFNKDNQVVDLTAASSINLKVADSQHAYIKTVSIDISDQSDLANGYLTIDLNDALINGLPSGTYFFEIWVNIDNETEIYPDSGFKSFIIKNNIEQGSSSYTTITLNDIESKLTETANTLQANVEQSIKDEISNGDFKGDKGDTGTVDNTGLTNAPAFQALQAQVNNSAVGTNLLTGTSQSSTTLNTDSTGHYNDKDITSLVTVGSTYTYQVIHTYLAHTSSITVAYTDSSGNVTYAKGGNIPWHSDGVGVKSTLIFTVPTTAVKVVLQGLIWTNTQWKDKIIYNSEKLEKGTVATDWWPNPSEVLTTANYNKLVAAIVALGGSV